MPGWAILRDFVRQSQLGSAGVSFVHSPLTASSSRNFSALVVRGIPVCALLCSLPCSRLLYALACAFIPRILPGPGRRFSSETFLTVYGVSPRTRFLQFPTA